MDHLENSLCATCEHLAYCTLTNNKRFIWSCSEYDVSIGHDRIYHERMLKTSSDLSTSYRNLELT